MSRLLSRDSFRAGNSWVTGWEAAAYFWIHVPKTHWSENITNNLTGYYTGPEWCDAMSQEEDIGEVVQESGLLLRKW